MNQPASISPRSSNSSNQEDLELCVESIVNKSRQHLSSQLEKPDAVISNSLSNDLSVSKVSNQDEEEDENEGDMEEIELEMLVEECEELISKITPGINHYYLQEEPTLVSEIQESFSMKKEKNRLEKEYIELCLEIERQQKELQNYKFKVQVAHKEAEYYSRQIKQKTAILDSLEAHSKKKDGPKRK